MRHEEQKVSRVDEFERNTDAQEVCYDAMMRIGKAVGLSGDMQSCIKSVKIDHDGVDITFHAFHFRF